MEFDNSSLFPVIFEVKRDRRYLGKILNWPGIFKETRQRYGKFENRVSVWDTEHQIVNLIRTRLAKKIKMICFRHCLHVIQSSFMVSHRTD